MSIDIHNKTIGELALEWPTAIPVLEKHHIDYCCRGGRSIAEACREAEVDPAYLLDALGDSDREDPALWEGRTLTDLQQYIVTTHHAYTRQAIETVRLLAEKVANRHGARHGEVLLVREAVFELTGELIPHMMKEEQILFPYVEALEAGEEAGGCFGTVAHPIRAMMYEHDAAGEKLEELRRLTSNYTLPADACLSFRALYETLMVLERDLHQHIHLENNLLFPRAVRLEESTLEQALLERAR